MSIPDIIGKTIVARVSRVEAYGVYLSYGQVQLIVLIPDVSREPVHDLEAKYRVGDDLVVRVLMFVEDQSLFKCTIKDAQTEDP